ncbi:MAG: cation diffusion facilitator family transporter [Bacteroidales bacterium]|nr:cation diffusion facilitator family transporter [Bacteroidales bacterium]
MAGTKKHNKRGKNIEPPGQKELYGRIADSGGLISESSVKLKVQRRIVLFSLMLFFAKMVAYFITNSVAVLTDALESIVNVTTGFITLYSISVAIKPRDKNHPFGHGKIESLSASLEGLMIIIAGLIIIYEAVRRFFDPAAVQQLNIAIVITGVAGLLNYIVGGLSIRTGRKHNSIALISGGRHLQSDAYSTAGLIAGLLIIIITGRIWIDSVIAIIFGIIILLTGIRILKETTSTLMDEADMVQLQDIVKSVSNNRSENWIEVHNLRLVKYGDSVHIDCDLTLPWYMTIREAHRESDLLKERVAEGTGWPSDMTIHTDACYPALCRICPIEKCHVRLHSQTGEVKWTLEKMISRDPQVPREK